MGAAASAISRHARPGRTHKMVFVANMELGMGKGKLAAQVGHACLGVYRFASSSEDVCFTGFWNDLIPSHLFQGQDALNAWRSHGEVKIAVKGSSTKHLQELNEMAKKLVCLLPQRLNLICIPFQKLYTYLVQDAGYTQIPAGSRTVLAVFGPLEDVDQVTGDLKLL